MYICTLGYFITCICLNILKYPINMASCLIHSFLRSFFFLYYQRSLFMYHCSWWRICKGTLCRACLYCSKFNNCFIGGSLILFSDTDSFVLRLNSSYYIDAFLQAEKSDEFASSLSLLYSYGLLPPSYIKTRH
jgi:hypothetical protein